MPRLVNPPSVHSPGGRYSHLAAMPAAARWTHVSGQVGQDATGRTLEGFAAQAEQAWRNVLACLAADGMGVGDVVKVVTYLVEASTSRPAARCARASSRATPRPPPWSWSSSWPARPG
jgi:enamine deaminase RidA (YjgF/YER057c/UK114 family)